MAGPMPKQRCVMHDVPVGESKSLAGRSSSGAIGGDRAPRSGLQREAGSPVGLLAISSKCEPNGLASRSARVGILGCPECSEPERQGPHPRHPVRSRGPTVQAGGPAFQPKRFRCPRPSPRPAWANHHPRSASRSGWVPAGSRRPLYRGRGRPRRAGSSPARALGPDANGHASGSNAGSSWDRRSRTPARSRWSQKPWGR